MIAQNTDIAIHHLGTNNILDKDRDGQCLLKCDDALEEIEQAHTKAHPKVPQSRTVQRTPSSQQPRIEEGWYGECSF